MVRQRYQNQLFPRILSPHEVEHWNWHQHKEGSKIPTFSRFMSFSFVLCNSRSYANHLHIILYKSRKLKECLFMWFISIKFWESILIINTFYKLVVFAKNPNFKLDVYKIVGFDENSNLRLNFIKLGDFLCTKRKKSM